MSSRAIARAAGVLFILTFVTAIAGVLAYGPVLTDANYVTGTGADGQVYVGAFLELLLIVANVGTAVVLFPILRRENEALALGYVTARLVEATLILIGIVSLLTVVSLRQAGPGTDAGALIAAGHSLVAARNWTFLLGPGLLGSGLGNGLLLGWLMYRSGLVPRRMALFGLVGGSLVCASGVAVLFGWIGQGSSWQSIATIPEVIWEAFLGLWLTFRGFVSSTPLARADGEP